MSDKRNIDIIVGFNAESLRAAAKNSKNLGEVVLDVPCVDATKLRYGDTIYNLKLVPVKDQIKRSTPETVMTLGLRSINVDSVSGIITPDHMTINGSIDIPKTTAGTNSLTNVYFENEEDARMVGMVFLEEEMVRAEEAVEAAKEVRDFLKEQFDNDRL